MYTVAVRTAGRRITSDGTWWWTAVPIAAGVVPAVVLLLSTGLVPVTGIAMIPVTGILIGGAMTATVLAGRQILAVLRMRHGEVEAALALGMLERDARVEIAGSAASEALVPGLDQTRTAGLVTLPGAFVGMLLGGASPLTAGAVQLFVLVALMAVQAVAVATTLELIARGRITAGSGHEKVPVPRRLRIPLLNVRRRPRTEPPDQTHASGEPPAGHPAAPRAGAVPGDRLRPGPHRRHPSPDRHRVPAVLRLRPEHRGRTPCADFGFGEPCVFQGDFIR